jgi:hypothetical protein
MDRTSEIILAHLHTKEIEEYGNLSLWNHVNYCKRHDLNWTFINNALDSRHPSWSRIQIIMNCFDQGYEWVFWVDPDAWIMNKDIDIRQYCDNNYNIILSKESSTLNLGVSLWRNCKENFNILTEIDMMEQFYDDTWYEQRAFLYLLSNRTELNNSIKIEDNRVFQGSINDDHSKLFVMHLPGTTTQERIRIFTEYEIKENR